MRNYFIILTTLFLLGSCANYVPLTSTLIAKNNWSKDQMKQIQYYTSSDIKLQRISSNSGSDIKGGVITEESNKSVDEVIIKQNTKGVAVSFPNDNIGVSFEKDDNHFLTFGANPDRNGYFVMMASEWKDRIGKVTYNGEKYYSSPESKDVILLVNMKKVRKLKVSQRSAEGREIK
jgi:hypothetical protein